MSAVSEPVERFKRIWGRRRRGRFGVRPMRRQRSRSVTGTCWRSSN